MKADALGGSEYMSRPFFSSLEEVISLVPPIIFLLILIPDFIWHYEYSTKDFTLMNLYANIFWLNAIHGSFFLAFPFADAKARSWLFGANNQNKAKFIGSFAAIFVVTFFIFSFTVGLLPNKSGVGNVIANIGFFVLLAVPLFHYIRQSYGLSRLYDAKYVPRKFSLDFYGFHIILIFVILAAIILNSKHLSPYFGMNTVKLLAATSFLVIFGLIFSSLFHDKSKKGLKKAIFQIRLFLHPLSFFHPLSGIFMRGTHGLEYYFVMRSLFKNQPVTKVFIYAFILISLVTVALMLTHHNGLPHLVYMEKAPPKWILLMSCFLYSISQMHYWTDYYLFSLKVTEERIDTPLKRLQANLNDSGAD